MNWLSKSEVRIVSAILASSMLLGSIPLNAGIVIPSYPKQPMFTLNICEPLQPGLSVTDTPIARPATSRPRLILLERGKLPLSMPKPLDDLGIAPESPPPKARV